jgi:prepilin-type processing-associated H-X9-DG protein
MVVIAIVAILAAFLYPALSQASRKSKAASSTNNLRQWGMAFLASAKDNDGRLPYDGQGSTSIYLDDPDSWFNLVPPYLGEKPLNDPYWLTNPPKPGDKSVWINPAVPADGTIFKSKYIIPTKSPTPQFLFCYSINYYLSKASDKTQPLSRIVRPSATVLMAEKNDQFANCNPNYIRAYHGVGNPLNGPDNSAVFLFCDGHVEVRKRTEFDPDHMTITADNPSPTDNVNLNRYFTFVPFEGATSAHADPNRRVRHGIATARNLKLLTGEFFTSLAVERSIAGTPCRRPADSRTFGKEAWDFLK